MDPQTKNYAVNDVTLQAVISTMSVIIANLLDYFNLLPMFFGNANIEASIGMIFVLLNCIITLLITIRSHKGDNNSYSQENKNEIINNETQKDKPKINITHFHFPIINQ